MTFREQKAAAKKFVEYWTFQKGSEHSEDQQFWNSLLGEVLGVTDIKSRIRYQVDVKLAATTKFLDAWIPETRVLIEHKSRGVNLDAPQAGHEGLTPYEQAKAYDDARGFNEKARWIVLSNFSEIRIHDCTKPLDPPQVVPVAALAKPGELKRLAFLVDSAVAKVDAPELAVSVQAGRIVGKLYDALRACYDDPNSPETLHALNKLCVRLVFCFYAEDADILEKDIFSELIAATPANRLRRALLDVFTTLDTPVESRGKYLEPELAAFPYTNGGLFAGATEGEIPTLTEGVKDLLVESLHFDWSGISPTIFGALFESTLNPETRRAGGMVYTSVENIHRVIDPLFLDDLKHRVDECVATAPSPSTRRKLLALQDEMAKLHVLDPACGSGNFLTETYLSLRRLENKVIRELQKGQSELDLGLSVKVGIAQFAGLEINDFAVTVAKTAMWISEAKMLRETSDILARNPDYLPLKNYTRIVEANALRTDWASLLPAGTDHFDYIIGNPPFIGARQMKSGSDQKQDMDATFPSWKNIGNLDYVSAWYKKAADLVRGKPTRCAFVSTNSITQGEQVALLWKPLMEDLGLVIDFAWRTFVWDSESFEKAHVHVVIIGFHVKEELTPSEAEGSTNVSPKSELKKIYDDGRVIEARHINAYLVDAPDVFVESRRTAYADLPLVFGSMPNDGGWLSDYDESRKAAIVTKYPQAESLFRPLVGSQEAINKISRWCLWLKGVSPSAFRSIPPIMDAVEKVRELRLASNRESTQKLADFPALFGEIRQPDEGTYLLIPSVSSERREYVPMCFLDAHTIANNLALIVPSATLYHFGVLTSSVHMAWMRAVAGRLEMRYRYSAAIVYNNFPWPTDGAQGTARTPRSRPSGLADARGIPTDDSGNVSQSSNPCDPCNPWFEKISATAQAILDARALYPDSTLADLYDPLTMPPELRKAHRDNDAAVLDAYGFPRDLSESDIVARLFELYAELVKPETVPTRKG